MKQLFTRALIFILTVFIPALLSAERVDEARIESEVIAPYSLGSATDIDGVWELLNGSGLQEGYVIESEAISTLPGFSGAPINMIIFLDLDGVIIDVKLLSQSEPIFVSGLGEAPFRAFLEQYRGVSIHSVVTVGTKYGGSSGGSQIYLDGVTKATASVRIAHESIMAAAREVAKQKLEGGAAPAREVSPKLESIETLTWQDVVERGYAKHVIVKQKEIRAQFSGTIWESDDPFSDMSDDEAYIDLWIVDISPPDIANAVAESRMITDLGRLRDIAPSDETVLLIEGGVHGLVPDDFVRNTSPASITASQDGFPLAMRDADILIDLKADVPDGRAMVVRIDRRLGFDPTREWDLGLIATREHGMFQPEIGEIELNWPYQIDEKFFDVTEAKAPLAPWQSAILNRLWDIVALAVFLTFTFLLMLKNKQVVQWRHYQTLRLVMLAICLGFIGWWGQGQLSIVTPLAVAQSIAGGKSVSFLTYDPFSLLIWLVVILSFFIWGRALFCGWLCPFGAMQEFVGNIARRVGIKQIRVPEKYDVWLRKLKYVVLLALVVIALWRPENVDKAIEVEPFKTAISVFFVRAPLYVAYAILCLAASLFVFKAYCRYLCPLGALMAIGGKLQLRPWIARRVECGSPCQLCKVQCRYGAIAKTGEVKYSECFGCLDCVAIYEDDTRCVPLILARKKAEAGK